MENYWLYTNLTIKKHKKEYRNNHNPLVHFFSLCAGDLGYICSLDPDELTNFIPQDSNYSGTVNVIR